MWENMTRSCNKFIKEIQFPPAHDTVLVMPEKRKKNNMNNGHHNSPALDDSRQDPAVVYIRG